MVMFSVMAKKEDLYRITCLLGHPRTATWFQQDYVFNIHGWEC